MIAHPFACPRCGPSRIHPSRSRGLPDAPLKLLLLRPWRCLRCWRRLWRPVWMTPADVYKDRPATAGEFVELRPAIDP